MSHLVTKPTKWHVRPAKTQISLGIRPVWSEYSLSTWRKLGSLATHWAHSEGSDQTGRMPRLIWVFAGRTVILLVLSRGGSNCFLIGNDVDFSYKTPKFIYTTNLKCPRKFEWFCRFKHPHTGFLLRFYNVRNDVKWMFWEEMCLINFKCNPNLISLALNWLNFLKNEGWLREIRWKTHFEHVESWSTLANFASITNFWRDVTGL